MAPVQEETLVRMRDTLIHRGPDDGGIWMQQHIGLGHRRLSIIDTSTNGHQPFLSEDGRYAMVFNGEIYNYQEFYPELKAKGYVFRSGSDTEVLLNLYREYGDAMLQRLNGMFAFAIWDTQEESLFIARDRVGVKPLYYSQTSSMFCFASEPKALFAAGIPKKLAEEHLAEWLLFRYVAGAETLYENVHALLPGYTVKLSRNNNFQPQFNRWWNLQERIQNHSVIANPAQWFEETFSSSIRYRMVSDVPVGILLSGGLDSSSVAAMVKQNGFGNINTFNVGFPGFIDDESSQARTFSAKLGFPFHSIEVNGDAYYECLTQATYVHDEPLIHQNDPQLVAISAYAKKLVTVLLSGEGSDELMGGYVRHRAFRYAQLPGITAAILSMIPKSFKSNRIQKLQEYLQLPHTSDRVLWNACNFYPGTFKQFGLSDFHISNPFRASIQQEAEQLYPDNPLRQTLYLDQHTYLCSLNTRNDRTTMAASIECREPFLDYRLIEGLGTLDDQWFIQQNQGKYILRSTLSPLLGEQVTSFRKIGFSIPWKQLVNQSEALQTEWNGFLNQQDTAITSMLKVSFKQITKEYKEGNPYIEVLLRQLYMFQFWQQQQF